MQVNFHVSPELKTEHAELFVQQLTPALQQVANQLLKEARLIWGYQADQMIPLDLQQVALISVVDQQVYAYLQDGRQLRLKQRLYQIEAQLSIAFVRVSKSEILNQHAIAYLEVTPSGLINAHLKNQQVAQVSRRRMKNLKRGLGL
jgi:DNA-binding LytR/AlgR family response regulator